MAVEDMTSALKIESSDGVRSDDKIPSPCTDRRRLSQADTDRTIDTIRLSPSITRDHRMVVAILSAGSEVAQRRHKRKHKMLHIFRKMTHKHHYNEMPEEKVNEIELINNCPLIQGESKCKQRRHALAERSEVDRLLVYQACRNYSQMEMLQQLS